MHVLVVEPYFGGSHRAWAEGYRAHSAFEVELMTLPARWWRWRMRGGFVTLAERAAGLAGRGYRPDVILATDMVDLAGLRGLLPRSWAPVPSVLYLHESQLTYPDSPQLEPDLSYAFTNWTSALAADVCVFNSEYHRESFFEEVPRLLRQFPDHRHGHLVEEVRERSRVVPVGVDLSWIRPSKSSPPLVLWNHRWEHDKNPEEFLRAIVDVAPDLDFRLALCGASFGNVAPGFARARDLLGDRVVAFGHAPLDRYRSLVNQTDVVVSTALQEFFGISVVEAVAAGAVPVLPDRLSYPEIIPAAVHAQVFYPEGHLAGALATVIASREARLKLAAVTAPAMTRYAWGAVAPLLDGLLAEAKG